MSEERKRVLEMLAEGKLNVDEAERLLAAMEDVPNDGPPDPDDPDDTEDGDFFDPFDGLGDEIRAGMAEAEAAVRQIGPEAVAAVKGAERIVRSVIRTTTRNRRRQSRSRGAREEVIRRFSDSRPFEPGATLSVRNGKGDVVVETWDQDEISFDVEIVARARTEEEAAALADAVEIDVLNAEDGVRIESSLPNEEGELRGSWVANLTIKAPAKADLDVESRHGQTRTPEIDGDVVVRNSHGSTTVGNVSGALRARQSHGNLDVGSVGADTSVDIRHGHLTMEASGGDLSLKNQDGNAKLGSVGKKLDLFSAHGNTTVTSVGANVSGRVRHSELVVTGDVAEGVVLDASHGALRSRGIGGDLEITVRHGSVTVEQVDGSVAIDGSHSPVEIRQVGADATAKSNHAHLTIERIGGGATVSANHCSVRLSGMKREVIVSGSRGTIDVVDVSGEVTIHSKRGPVSVRPDGPVTRDIRISTHRAPIDLVLLEGSDAEVEGTVRHGEVLCSVPALDVNTSNKVDHRVTGRLGNGSAQVQLETFRGDLRLEGEVKSKKCCGPFDSPATLA